MFACKCMLYVSIIFVYFILSVMWTQRVLNFPIPNFVYLTIYDFHLILYLISFVLYIKKTDDNTIYKLSFFILCKLLLLYNPEENL